MQKNASTQQAYNEKYKTIFFETIYLYIKELSERFEPSNLLSLIKIFNLITDSEFNDECLEIYLFIYRDCVINLESENLELKDLEEVIDEFALYKDISLDYLY